MISPKITCLQNQSQNAMVDKNNDISDICEETYGSDGEKGNDKS